MKLQFNTGEKLDKLQLIAKIIKIAIKVDQ